MHRFAWIRGLLARLLASALLSIVVGSNAALAAGVTSDLQKKVRAATFEVVMKKPDKDPLTYEKPLPLELLPYLERTDLYKSIGTAFALGNNTYVTAAHVLIACISSQNGPPALRGSDGAIHPLERVLKFSQHEDFAVFSVAGDPAPGPLATNREPQIDDPVLAVGNALGEGIVIRDGLYTSATPEDQDGLWKWIRFSAAASPGNSGGPLLDSDGRVVGIVIGKSQNENLNYALPIARVLDAPAGQASFNERDLESLPFVRNTRTFSYQQQFAIARGWNEFVAAYRGVIDTHADDSRKQLLDSVAAEFFPKGEGVESVLYDVVGAYDPGVIAQGSDGAWGARWASYQRTDLANDGYVRVGIAGSTPLLRLRRPANASDAAFWDDSKASMDLMLKGLNLRREVGSDQVRVTSAGPALSSTLFVDHYGRRWQERVWALPYTDAYAVLMMLPTPDGYATMLQYAPSLQLREMQRRLELNADLFYVSYRGTLPQWQSFLARRDLIPDALREIRLVKLPGAGGWEFKSKRLELTASPELLKLDDRSVLGLRMAYLQDGKRTVWDVGGVDWYQDEQEKIYVSLRRQPRAPDNARRPLRDRWQDMFGRHNPYTGSPTRVSAAGWEVESVLDVPGERSGMAAEDLVYGMTVHVEDPVDSRDVARRQAAAQRAVRILEIGTGARALYTGNAVTPASTSTYANPATPTTASVADDLALDAISDSLGDSFSFKGPDIRGRHPSDDIRDLVLTPALRDQLTQLREKIGAASDQNRPQDMVDLKRQIGEVLEQRKSVMMMLVEYWMQAEGINHAEEQWRLFLERNHLPSSRAHSAEVIGLRHQLVDNWQPLADKGELAKSASALLNAYVTERRAAARDISFVPDPAANFEPRKSACPAPSTAPVAGTQDGRIRKIDSAEDYYPAASKRLREEGSVILSIRLDTTGCPQAIAIAASSGSDALDAAAKQLVFESAAYDPASVDGKPVETVKKLSIRFEMLDNP